MDPIVVYAQAFISEFGNDCGHRLEKIGASIGLRVTYADADSFDGALLRVAGKARGIAVINANIREPGRQRFTLAHEVAHYVLPHQDHRHTLCRTRDIENWAPGLSSVELEANRFAAEILMPQALIAPLLRLQPSLDVIKKIGKACGTSLTASAYRLVQLSSYRVAIVLSTRRSRHWYKASEEFGRAIERGPVSPDSFAYDAFRSKSVPDRLESVPATAWLYEANLREDAKVWEHSVPMAFYDGVLTLLSLREPVEEHTDYDEPDDSLDPTEFTLQRKKWPRR